MNEREVKMEQLYTYRTNFKLLAPVFDYKGAQEYLQQYNMGDYLVSNISQDGRGFEDIIFSAKWYLNKPKYDETDSGYIEVITTKELNKEQKKYVSEWIKGQNSDGIGECFEQQDWSGDERNDMFVDDYYDEDEYDMCSFDWRTNNYELTLIH